MQKDRGTCLSAQEEAARHTLPDRPDSAGRAGKRRLSAQPPDARPARPLPPPPGPESPDLCRRDAVDMDAAAHQHGAVQPFGQPLCRLLHQSVLLVAGQYQHRCTGADAPVRMPVGRAQGRRSQMGDLPACDRHIPVPAHGLGRQCQPQPLLFHLQLQSIHPALSFPVRSRIFLL